MTWYLFSWFYLTGVMFTLVDVRRRNVMGTPFWLWSLCMVLLWPMYWVAAPFVDDHAPPRGGDLVRPVGGDDSNDLLSAKQAWATMMKGRVSSGSALADDLWARHIVDLSNADKTKFFAWRREKADELARSIDLICRG